MKTGGYYFCDRCEENAFGETCWKCHHPSRWIAAGLAVPPAVVEPAKPVSHKLTRLERATWWFAEMRRVVADAPDHKR